MTDDAAGPPETGPSRPRPRPRSPGRPRPRAETDTATTPATNSAPPEPDLSRFLAASEPQPGDDDRERPPRRWPAVLRAGLGRSRRLFRYVVVVIIVVAVALLLRTFVVSPYYIPSASMEPTLHGCPNCNDDYVLVDKISYRLHDPRRQDIVVFDRPPNFAAGEDVLIKRVIATGGQTVRLRGGQVYVDGLRTSEPYVNRACGANPTKPSTGTSSWSVPDGSIFVMGDNRCNSSDSRVFGPIKVSSVIGRAWLRFWPLKRFGTVG